VATRNLIGKVVGGCQILSEIASGGMGEVYKAKQLSLDRDVAVKILADRLAGDPDFVERFQREARAVARINHPNILAVYEVGCDPDLNLHYMMMELIDGRSLSDIIHEQGVLPPRVGAEYVRQAALGLACAQQSGVIHRDVKPDNIMVTRQNVVKVSDFGLAKEIDGSSMTATDSVMGTPAYMSPEQCDGKKLDGRTDIYSLGGTFFRLLTGRLPFEAETAMSMMYRHKHEPVTPPKQIVPAVPQAMSDIVVKMMAKRREDRFQSMEDAAKAIEQALSTTAEGRGDTEQTVVVPQRASGGAPVAAAPPASGIIASPRRREMDRLIAQGDARLRRGDLAGAARFWREARAIEDDPRVKERLEQHALPEAQKSKEAGEQRIAAGQLSEAARLYRQAVELNPDDEDSAARLQEIEERVAKRREAVNQVRQLLASNRHEEAVAAWDELPDDFHDDSLERQVKQIRDVVLPVSKLCAHADEALTAGDLEQAANLYRRAADVDMQSERAKTGVREAERRMNRIERMLKEGYEFNVKEDYERAIDAWEGIVKVAPSHARAKKLITEARLRLGHSYRQKESKLDQAIEQWKKIVKIDPEHRVAQALLEEDLACRANLARLSEEAQAAYARHKYGRAIYAWQKMLDLDPSNRKIAHALEGAKKIRRKRRTVRLVVFLAIVVVGTTASQFTREWLTLRKADELQQESRLGDAVMTIDAFSPTVFLRGVLSSKKRDLVFKRMFRDAKRERDAGRYDSAMEFYERAKGFVGDEDRPMLKDEIERTKVIRVIAKARSSEKAGDWEAARRNYLQAADMAKKAKLDRETQEAEKYAEFLRLVIEALRAEKRDDRVTAKGFWEQAREKYRNHEVVLEAVKRLGMRD
jgi:tetratricopeptide (TPR) repeat protein